MNIRGIFAIYVFEMSRTFRTLTQSIASPVVSTILYFIVFGSAIGSRIDDITGLGLFLFFSPMGLIMLTVLNQSLSNASFGIFFPKFSGTIYEILSALFHLLKLHRFCFCSCNKINNCWINYSYNIFFSYRNFNCSSSMDDYITNTN